MSSSNSLFPKSIYANSESESQFGSLLLPIRANKADIKKIMSQKKIVNVIT